MKAIFIGSVGNLVEWYDFYAYTAFALYFAPAFFPHSDPVVQQLNAAVLFAATFLMRPLGGWLFGFLADRYGRRLSLTLSVVCMCFGSLIIAVTPTYADDRLCGACDPARAGARHRGAEPLRRIRRQRHLSQRGRRPASTAASTPSFQYVTLIGGQLTAIIVLLLLQKVFLTPERAEAWGWRIPFVIGALLAIVAAVMRRGLHETEAFEEAEEVVAKPTGSIVGLLELSARIAAGGRPHRRRHRGVLHLHHLHADLRETVGRPDRGPDHLRDLRLADLRDLPAADLWRAVGPHRPQAAVDLLRCVSARWRPIPLLTALKETKSPFIAFLLICAAWIFVAGYTSINAIVKAELFPTSVRALGVGLPYAHHGVDLRRHRAGDRARGSRSIGPRRLVLLLSRAA